MHPSGQTEFALVQHPMILLIHLDRGTPTVGERVPPWGAPDMKEYAQRVRRNLEAMHKYPDLKLNYEFSGIELQILADEAPDVIPVMRQFVAEGRLAFLGGDYSQPHGHLFSGELNFRQIEHGLKIFQDLVGYRVTNNFHQETCLHDQLPQLLKAFGFKTATTPNFAHTITPLPGAGLPSLVGSTSRSYAPVDADSVALWCGLDGTELPVLIPSINTCGTHPDMIRSEQYRGLWRGAGVHVLAPDMEEITPERYEFLRSHGKMVLLDRAVEESIARQAPTWRARLHSYWSYSEGEWAEAVSREIRRAETALLAEEALAANQDSPSRGDLDADWKTVLAAMHHDVHWIEVTDLKQQYIDRMEKVIEKSLAASAKHVNAANSAPRTDQRIRVANPLPYGRKEVASFHLPGNQAVRVTTSDGRPCPTQCVPSVDGSGLKVLFVAEVPPLGVVDYALAPDAATATKGTTCQSADIAFGPSRCVIGSDATVHQISRNGVELLSGPGHDLHYLGADGSIVGGPLRDGSMRRYSGEVGDLLRINSPVGDIPVHVEFLAAAANGRLDIATTFDFHNHAIGVMWQDWTKLNSYWPVNGRTIRHDIPYGSVTGQERVPLYAPSWLSIRNSSGGIALLNAGTPKHYVEDGRIACVWAWGGNVFCNRMHVDWEKKNQYDLRLRGRQTIRLAAMALSSDDGESGISREGQRFNSPLLVFASGGESAAVGDPAPDLGKTDLVVTAVTRHDGRLSMRCFEAAGRKHSISEIASQLGQNAEYFDLAGARQPTIRAYQIGYVVTE